VAVLASMLGFGLVGLWEGRRVPASDRVAGAESASPA
jgi:hypothetical protein